MMDEGDSRHRSVGHRHARHGRLQGVPAARVFHFFTHYINLISIASSQYPLGKYFISTTGRKKIKKSGNPWIPFIS